MSGIILSDIQILSRLVAEDDSCIFVSPLLNPSKQLGPSSLDLHLGTDLIVTRNINITHIDLANKSELRMTLPEYYESRKVIPSGRFILHPGEFALASTLEYLRLPIDIAGRLEGRSSIGRLGLQVHATAGYVDPGFAGTLTFELINSGKLPLMLSPGIRLGQMCFFKIEDVQVDYMSKEDSKYGGSYGVERSRIDEDSN